MKRLSFLVLPLLVMTGCRQSTNSEVKHNYHEIKQCLIDWVDIFNQKEDNYLVYFYSERCSHCNEIKCNVISYYLLGKEVMYFVCTDIDAIFGPIKNLKGISNIDDFYIFGTPFLTRILNYKVNDYYAGTKAILSYLNI